MEYGIAFAVAFITVGLKGFQHKNVIGNHYKLVAVTSYLMAVGDVVTVSIIMRSGWDIAIWLGSGAAIGMIVSMKLHSRYVKPSADHPTKSREPLAHATSERKE